MQDGLRNLQYITDIVSKIAQVKLKSCLSLLQITVKVSVCNRNMKQTIHWLVSIELSDWYWLLPMIVFRPRNPNQSILAAGYKVYK